DNIGTVLVKVNLALHAKALLIRDIHYIVNEGELQLIDASKGRVADLQRWPDGLQAAVEAKEGLEVSEGGRILDTITLQELMRRYPTVCGMTGTAVEATDQLRQFYDLHVSVIDRNNPLQRFDEQDRVYATMAEKNKAIVAEIQALNATGQPVLVGTQDVAESEDLAEALAELGIEVNVLNAKNDEEEARIIAEAGDEGRVTVSTQMAGRGTDIKLGGADESDRAAVVERGGLAVLGTSRHRTARLDNQLRGRSGRQGDPGLSLFFVSLEDDLVVQGGEDDSLVFNPGEDGRIESKRVNAFVAHCQRVTEGQLLEIHAQTWKYNQLLADQRIIIDKRRANLLDTDQAWKELAQRAPQRVAELADVPEAAKVAAAREIMLFHLDLSWADHLELMDDVRESIHLRAIARETPIDEYHRIAVREFKELAQRAVDDSVETFNTVQINENGAHLDDSGLARPSATWTYMVSDNPLAGSGNSVIGGIGNLFR
ncbi:MAG: accessory Sec system translocase SecA2, partial [Corynebacterium casei]